VSILAPLFDSSRTTILAKQVAQELFRFEPSVYARCFDKRRLIFVHVPKAAGTSISQTLYGGSAWHYSAAELRLINPLKFGRYPKVSFVRNPFDRLRSTFAYAPDDSHRFRYSSLTFLLRYATYQDFLSEGLCEELIRTHYFFWTQHKYLHIGARSPLDFIGRFERLDDDYARLAQRYNLAKTPLPHLNRSTPKAQEAALPARLVAKIRRLYAIDFDAFGYSAEPAPREA